MIAYKEGVVGTRRGIILHTVYLEYQSVCPIVRIGSPPPPPCPLSRKRVCSPLGTKGGGGNKGGEGAGGSQFERLERKPGTLSTLYWHISTVDDSKKSVGLSRFISSTNNSLEGHLYNFAENIL
jgi:hypothetical protein